MADTLHPLTFQNAGMISHAVYLTLVVPDLLYSTLCIAYLAAGGKVRGIKLGGAICTIYRESGAMNGL